ncbi:MAG TPA: hypothetical protein PK863_02075 [Candidatus Dojkabacteria bacterium]|nr:hypothetical protein [Candidatus Dojkabacteria bacterium]
MIKYHHILIMLGETPTDNLILFFLEKYPGEMKKLGNDSGRFGYVPLISLESGCECLCPDISGISEEDFQLFNYGDPFQSVRLGRYVSGIGMVLGKTIDGKFIKIGSEEGIFFMSPMAHVIVAREV